MVANVTTIVYPGHLRSWSMRQFFRIGPRGSIATKGFSSSLLWVGSWDKRTGINLSGDDDRLSVGVLVEISDVFFVQLNFDILISIHVEVYCSESLKLRCCRLVLDEFFVVFQGLVLSRLLKRD